MTSIERGLLLALMVLGWSCFFISLARISALNFEKRQYKIDADFWHREWERSLKRCSILSNALNWCKHRLQEPYVEEFAKRIDGGFE